MCALCHLIIWNLRAYRVSQLDLQVVQAAAASCLIHLEGFDSTTITSLQDVEVLLIAEALVVSHMSKNVRTADDSYNLHLYMS